MHESINELFQLKLWINELLKYNIAYVILFSNYMHNFFIKSIVFLYMFRALPGRANIVDQPLSGKPVSVTDDKHQKQVDELIKHDRRITKKQIAGRLGMSKERVGYIIGLLGHKSLFSMGATHVDAGKETKTCWNLWRTFEALSRRGRSISFEYCYWGWVIDSSFWPWRKMIEHWIQAHLWTKQRTPEFFIDGMRKLVLR